MDNELGKYPTMAPTSEYLGSQHSQLLGGAVWLGGSLRGRELGLFAGKAIAGRAARSMSSCPGAIPIT